MDATDWAALVAFAAWTFLGLGAVPAATARAQYTRRWALAPPAWVFPVAWGVLYPLVAAAGFLLWHGRAGGWAYHLGLAAWAANAGLNKLWTPLYFGARRPDAALACLAAMQALAAAALVCMALAGGWQGWTALGLYAPYALWCAFASALNVRAVVDFWNGDPF